MKPTLKTIAKQPSWVIRSREVEVAVTQLGGHMAPVTFYRHSSAPVQPYYINPWYSERRTIDDPVLVPLRGDFFCLPFGARCEYKRKTYCTHGEPASAKWRLGSTEKTRPVTTMTLTMNTKLPPGKITKRLSLVDGHNVVYVQHKLEGFSGRFPLGHHATLAMPDEPQTVHFAASPLRFGMTNPIPPEDPAEGGYYSLGVNKLFHNLKRVATVWGDKRFTDCSSFPARKGHCDLLGVFNKPNPFPAWMTATFEKEGFLWFALKDPTVLPMLMMWVENHGRHYAPYDGRNNCLGLEDICGFFSQGLAASLRSNVLTKHGVETAMKLSPREPTIINYIEGVVKVPNGFKKVNTATFAPGKMTFLSVTGKKVTTEVHHEFLETGGF